MWAFLGGLTANLLTSDPLGSLPLGLLLAAAAVAVLVRLIERPPAATVLLGGFSGSLVVDVTGLAVLVFAGSASMALSPASFVSLFVPSALVNAVLALAVWYGLRAVLMRVGPEPAGA
jgi:cell shape-determining protein MreD